MEVGLGELSFLVPRPVASPSLTPKARDYLAASLGTRSVLGKR